jgi:hypothetical protein
MAGNLFSDPAKVLEAPRFASKCRTGDAAGTAGIPLALNKQKAGATPAVPALRTERKLAIMVIGLFLLCLTAFAAVCMFAVWLFRFLASATMADAGPFVAVLAAGAAMVILFRTGQRGVIVAAAVIVFWYLFIYGTEPATVVTTIAIAAATLVVAAAAALANSFARRRAFRQQP